MSRTLTPIRRSAAAVVAAVFLAAAAPASAQSAAVLYARAQEREESLAKTKDAPAADLRAVARSYEAIVRRYPSSGFADNALWQAAGLFEAAHALGGDRSDLEKAVELLRWLQREYPSSSLKAQAATRVSTLEASASPAPETTLAPSVSTQPLPAVEPRTAAPPAVPKANPASQNTAALRGVTYAPLPRGDRITIEVSREVPFAADRVASPDRVFFDFHNAAAAAAVVERAQQLSGRLIRAIRLGHPSAGVTRVVLELVGTPRYSSFPLYDPFRLVIDLETDAELPAADPPASSASAVPPAGPVRAEPAPASLEAPNATPPAPAPTAPAVPAATRNGGYSLARQLGLGISRVVIDPGHGGHDPGAMANGVTEAALVLDIAQRLEKLLQQKPGFEVVLTRRANEFIPLEERTAIANREGADLFLSIHANAGRNTAARGIETYFLNFATNPAAEAVAARENATSGQTMGTLPAILKAIALNNKLAESRELATILQTSMMRRLRAQNKAAKDLGVKQAPFVVLIGAQMPSVLAEISFVTNRAEAGLLKQSNYRQQIAQALCDAIVRYQGSLKKTSTGPVGVAAR